MANVMQNFPSSLNPGVGAALTQPVAPVPGTGQQSDPSLWKRFLTSLQQNPALQQSLMTTGLSLMGSPQPGESGFGTFSRSALQGVQNYTALNQLSERNRREQEGLDLQRQNVESLTDTRSRTAGTAEERTEIARGSLTQRDEQFEARLKAISENLDKQLASDLEIAGIRATSAGGAAGSTGAERQAALAKEAYLASGLYPRTEQGMAMAELRAQRHIGKNLVNPQDQYDFAVETASQILLFNPNMPESEAVDKAFRLTTELAKRLNATDESVISSPNAGTFEADADEHTGKSLTLPNGQAGTLEFTADGYKVRVGDILYPRNGSLTKEQVEAELAKQGQTNAQ